MQKLLLSALLVFSASVQADDLCSGLKTVKDCAELGCHWSDADQSCSDKRPAPAAVVLGCDSITSIEICESHPDCRWDLRECVERNPR